MFPTNLQQASLAASGTATLPTASAVRAFLGAGTGTPRPPLPLGAPVGYRELSLPPYGEPVPDFQRRSWSPLRRTLSDTKVPGALENPPWMPGPYPAAYSSGAVSPYPDYAPTRMPSTPYFYEPVAVASEAAPSRAVTPERVRRATSPALLFGGTSIPSSTAQSVVPEPAGLGTVTSVKVSLPRRRPTFTCRGQGSFQRSASTDSAAAVEEQLRGMRFNFYKDPRELPVEVQQAALGPPENPPWPPGMPPPPPRPGVSQAMQVGSSLAPQIGAPPPPTNANLEAQIQELLEGQENLRYELAQVRMQVSSNSQNLEVLRRESHHLGNPMQAQSPSRDAPVPAARGLDPDAASPQLPLPRRDIPSPGPSVSRRPEEEVNDLLPPEPPQNLGYSNSQESIKDTLKGRLSQAYQLFRQ